ncbi:hypothetical protein [Rhodococcus chondri]|uniref:Uncharacterized protein n=1 Tax=Rhodococcus chondri TaxID=3065941 RepID=A0ABU7JPL9_9NOCA|nr:hypothetical protein [Rhodococcus sp. CC-R104]MEE2031272.1 hypothetical protein [Rhodococcus sp. CC-R104]
MAINEDIDGDSVGGAEMHARVAENLCKSGMASGLTGYLVAKERDVLRLGWRGSTSRLDRNTGRAADLAAARTVGCGELLTR